MRWLFLLLIVVVVVLLVSISVEAKMLYVDQGSGDDSVTYANNDADNPWLTIGRAAWGSTVRASPNPSEAAQAGDVVIVRAGTYTTTGTNSRYIPAYNPVNSGTAVNPITFQAESGVVLVYSSGIGPTIGAYGQDYIIWDGFSVDEALTPGAPDESAAVLWESTGCVIRNCEIDGNGNPGSGALHGGIFISGSNSVTIQNNFIHAVRTNSESDANAAGILVVDCGGDNLIEHNEITDSNSGFFIKRSHDVPDGRGKWTIRYNYIHDSSYGFRIDQLIFTSDEQEPTKTVEIYQNLVKNMSSLGIILWRYENVETRLVHMVNNIIWNCGDSAFQSGGFTPEAGHIFWNNIVGNCPLGFKTWDYSTELTPTTFDAEHNIYYDLSNHAYIGFEHYPEEGILSFAEWLAIGQDNAIPESQETDPLYVDEAGGDFRLQGGSPARNAGMDILDLDNDGLTTDTINMGAYITGDEVIGVLDYTAPSQPECDDLVDNDGDGFTDFMATGGDQGCMSLTDNDETDCGDGVCEGGETCTDCPGDCLQAGEACCNGVAYNPAAQVCCSGAVYTGNCCEDANCTSPETCISHVCSSQPGTTVSVDSTYPGYTTDVIDDGVIDPYGMESTNWASGESFTEPHWVTIDFSQPREISNVTIYWAYNFVMEAFMSSQEVWIQYWNGIDYENASTITNTGYVEASSTSFDPVTTAGIRVFQPPDSGPIGYSNILWLTEIDYFQSYHRADTNPQDGCIELQELLAFIKRWKVSSRDVTMPEMMEAMGLWKAGTGC